MIQAVVNGVLTIRLNVRRFGWLVFYFPFPFFPHHCYFSSPRGKFSLSIHFARRICETRQYMRHRVTLSIPAFSIFLPCLSSSPCCIYSCIFFFFFGILIFFFFFFFLRRCIEKIVKDRCYVSYDIFKSFSRVS